MAIRFSIVRSLLCGMILAPAATSAAQKIPSQLAFMKPVTIVGRTAPTGSQASSAQVVASYQLACGESFRGVVIREVAPGISRTSAARAPAQLPTLEVAVLVDRKEAFCSSLPKTVTFEVPVKVGAKVRSIKLREPRRMTLEAALDIATSDAGLSIGWQTSCRPIMGVLLRPVLQGGAPKLEVALVRSSRDDSGTASPLNCSREVEQINLSTVDFAADALVLGQRPGKIESSYFLRLAAPQSISTSQHGRLEVKWSQSCRERALGIVFLGDRGEDVAVVSAVVPSAVCQGAKRSNVVTTVSGFSVSRGYLLKPASPDMVADLGATFKFNYSVIPAARVEPNSSDELGNIAVLNKSPLCGTSLGVIAAGDTYGNISLGVLVGSPESVCMVSGQSGVDRLQAPLVPLQMAPAPRIFGLRVFGNTFN